MTRRIRCLPPVSPPDAAILILGSMPGAESLAQRQYYAHPSNKFWLLIGTILGFQHDVPYEERLLKLVESRIALWDVLASCVREGSMDSGITHARVNKFAPFFNAHPDIVRIVFNGAAAERLFVKHVHCAPLGMNFSRAPSTSPANASIPYSAKFSNWRSALAPTLFRTIVS